MKANGRVSGGSPRWLDPKGFLHRLVRAFTAALAFFALGLSNPAVASTEDDYVGASHEVTSAPSWRRFALNALVVPLLEPDGPTAWVVRNELLPCRDNADVRVDGAPLPAGRALPLYRRILLRFKLDDCWPLGNSWIGLTGIVEVTLVNVGPRLVAHVRPVDLTASMYGARVPLRDAFGGVVALHSAAVRP